MGKRFQKKESRRGCRSPPRRVTQSFREKAVLVDFCSLALLWVTRAPKVVPGWGDAFPPHYVTDGTTAAALAIVLFLLPAQQFLARRYVVHVAWIMKGRLQVRWRRVPAHAAACLYQCTRCVHAEQWEDLRDVDVDVREQVQFRWGKLDRE